MAHIIITTKQGKKKRLTGYSRSLAFREDVKFMFDRVQKTKPYFCHWDKCKELAAIYNVTPHRIYQILKEYGY